MNLLKMYHNLSKFPLGRHLFSWLFCMKAPYFGTIRPYFEDLQKGLCIVTLKKRRAVHNHLGSVHAIAMCNMAEAAAGLCMEASLGSGLRWIPKKMSVEYLKKAMTDLKAVCRFDPLALVVGENPIEVDVFDSAGEKVFRAVITMYVSAKKVSV